MTDVNVPHRVSGVGRLGKVAAWISAVGCLPYLVLKLVWTVGMPVGSTPKTKTFGLIRLQALARPSSVPPVPIAATTASILRCPSCARQVAVLTMRDVFPTPPL